MCRRVPAVPCRGASLCAPRPTARARLAPQEETCQTPGRHDAQVPTYPASDPTPPAGGSLSSGVPSTGTDPLVPPPRQHPPFPGTEDLDPREVFAGPGYQAPRPRLSRLAVLALVAGIASVVPGVGVLAVLVGAIGVRRLRHTYGPSLSLCWFGIVAGAASTVFYAWARWLLTL